MSATDKLIHKLGSSAVSWVLLFITIVGCVFIINITSSSKQAGVAERANQQNTQLLQAAVKSVEKQVASWQQQLTNIANQPLTRTVAEGNTSQSQQWQQMVELAFPDVLFSCVLDSTEDTPRSDACLPITYASLNSFRQLQEKDTADVAMIMIDGKPSHILLTRPIRTESDESQKLLAIGLKPESIDLINRQLIQNAYIEISQGNALLGVLSNAGQPQLKQGQPSASAAVPSSHWNVNLWMPSTSVSQTNWLMIASLAGLLILMWVLREWWQKSVLKNDAAVLEEQLGDLQQVKLKTKYPIALKELITIRNLIHQIALPERKTPLPVDQPSLIVEEVSDESSRLADQIEDTSEPELDTSEATDIKINKDIIEYDVAIEQDLPADDDINNLEQNEESSLSSQSTYLTDSVEMDANPVNLSFESDLDDNNPTIRIDPDVSDSDEKSLNTFSLELADIDDQKESLQLEKGQNSFTEDDSAYSLDPPSNENLPDESIFRAYDIRGVVGEQLTVPIMTLIGRAVGSQMLSQGQDQLVVGYDGRLSSQPLAKAFMRGVLNTGCHVIELGQVATPLVYFASERVATHSGAMITGSHNPSNYNGIKLVIAGKTLVGDEIQAIYRRIKNGAFKVGKGEVTQDDVTDAYVQRIKSDITLERKIKVVVDCGNGVAGTILPRVLKELGCQVIELFCDVDGKFPNHHPNPGDPANLKALITEVKSSKADLGIATDGDGDRIGVVDGQGNIVWPDELMILFARDVIEKSPGATVMYDVKSTSLLEGVIRLAGGEPMMVPSGHSIIKNKMAEHGALLAAEMSGHFFFKDRWYGFDDASYTAARLLEILASDPTSRTPTELFSELTQRVSTPEIIVNMPISEAKRFMNTLKVNFDSAGGELSTIDGIRIDYSDGWGLVRASNTMPALTLRFEAINETELNRIKQIFVEQMLQVKPNLILKI